MAALHYVNDECRIGTTMKTVTYRTLFGPNRFQMMGFPKKSPNPDLLLTHNQLQLIMFQTCNRKCNRKCDTMEPVIGKTPSNLLFLIHSFTRKRSLLLISPTPILFKSYAEICATLLRQCTTSSLPRLGRSLHAHVIHSGLLSDFSVSTKLLTFYSSLNLSLDRDRLFQESVAKRDSVFIPFSHNFMISQLARSGDIDGACKVFDQMPEKSPISWTAMVDGLMKCGRVREAMRLYRTCPFRTICSSTAIISGFVSNELYKEALVFFL